MQAVEADIGQRLDRPELAGDPAQFEDGVQGRLSGIARGNSSFRVHQGEHLVGDERRPETVGVT